MPKALPGPTTDRATHDRIRHDRVDKAGSVTLRHNSRLHHLGIGRTHAGTCVILLIQDLDIRIVHAATGELLRELVLDPTRDYQPTGTPKGPARTPPKSTTAEPTFVGPAVADVLRHHMVGLTGFEPAASSSRTTRATKLRHTPCRGG